MKLDAKLISFKVDAQDPDSNRKFQFDDASFKTSEIDANVTFAVIANPMRRCGVHLSARSHATSLNCQFFTEIDDSINNKFDFVYIHWHPNFFMQHPIWVEKLRAIKIPVVLIVHDFAFGFPNELNILAFASFDPKTVFKRDVIYVPMPLQQPYPFKPRTQPNPDMCGFFGFYTPTKGLWTILTYAKEHGKKARFITTLHPTAPSWFAYEFSEFIATAKRLQMEVITDWLEGQELADVMGECGFFIVMHRGEFGASASATSALAAQRPVYAKKNNPFLKATAKYVLEFQFEKFPSESELKDAEELVKLANEELDPVLVWTDLHRKVIAKFLNFHDK